MATTKQTTTTPRTPNYFSNLKSEPNANINVFAAVNQGAKGTGINLAPKNEKDIEELRNKQIVANNLENIPQINWSVFPDLPNNIKDKIMPKVTNAGAERGYLLHLTKNMGSTDFKGKAGVTERIGLNEDLMLNKIPNELKLLQAKFEGFNEDMYNGNVSDLIDEKEKAFISDLVSGKVPMELDENGNFFFMKDGVPTRTKDLGSYTNTNYEAGGEFVTAFTNAFDKGQKLTKNQEALMRNNFVQKANTYSDGDLMSAAFEDVMKMGGPLLDRTQEPYATMLADMKGIDPRKKMEARENLELALEDAYMAKLNEQANLGFDALQSKKTPISGKSKTIGGVPGYANEDGNVDVMNFYNQYDFGYDAVSFEGDGSVSAYSLDQHLGDKPETSELGIYLASNGYSLGISGKTYMFEGQEMDGEQAKSEAVAKMKEEAYREEYMVFMEARSRDDKKKQAELLGKYIEKGKNLYSLSSRKLAIGNTKDERAKYSFDVDPNKPETLQAAIQKLSKLN